MNDEERKEWENAIQTIETAFKAYSDRLDITLKKMGKAIADIMSAIEILTKTMLKHQAAIDLLNKGGKKS